MRLTAIDTSLLSRLPSLPWILLQTAAWYWSHIHSSDQLAIPLIQTIRCLCVQQTHVINDSFQIKMSSHILVEYTWTSPIYHMLHKKELTGYWLLAKVPSLFLFLQYPVYYGCPRTTLILRVLGKSLIPNNLIYLLTQNHLEDITNTSRQYYRSFQRIFYPYCLFCYLSDHSLYNDCSRISDFSYTLNNRKKCQQ